MKQTLPTMAWQLIAHPLYVLMTVTDLAGPRFDLALERFLQREDVLNFGFFSLSLQEDGMLLIVVESRLMRPTEASARQDLTEAQAAVARLLEESPEIREAVAERPRKYEVILNYGNGAVRIAQGAGEQFEWSGS